MIEVLVSGSDGSFRHNEYPDVVEAYTAIFNWLLIFNQLHIDWKEDELITLSHGPTRSVVFVIHLDGTEGMVGHA